MLFTVCVQSVQEYVFITIEKEAYGTRSSQAVPHPSTILARQCLTSVIGRERVYSSWYGRERTLTVHRASYIYICNVYVMMTSQQKLTTPGVPRRSPIQVLSWPDDA